MAPILPEKAPEVKAAETGPQKVSRETVNQIISWFGPIFALIQGSTLDGQKEGMDKLHAECLESLKEIKNLLFELPREMLEIQRKKFHKILNLMGPPSAFLQTVSVRKQKKGFDELHTLCLENLRQLRTTLHQLQG